MNKRRNFLGSLLTAITAPAIGQAVLPPPKTARGMTSTVLHVDEFAYQPVMGKPGQVLMHTESGMEWRDPPSHDLQKLIEETRIRSANQSAQALMRAGDELLKF